MIRLPTHTNRLSGLNCLQSCVLSLSAFVANGLSPGEERIEYGLSFLGCGFTRSNKFAHSVRCAEAEDDREEAAVCRKFDQGVSRMTSRASPQWSGTYSVMS